MRNKDLLQGSDVNMESGEDLVTLWMKAAKEGSRMS